MNLNSEFEAQLIDECAPSPPHLPIPNPQALGTGHCQTRPSDVSEDSLNHDSSYDIIE